MTDPLAMFYTWPIVVERKIGQGAAGTVFAAPDGTDGTLKARVRAERKLVRSAQGQEVISEARVTLPVDTPIIPPGSRVTLPARWSNRVALVIVEGLHDAGLPIAFYAVDLT